MDDSKKKILVVEDEKSISDIIKYNLEKEGFVVYTSYDGEDALAKQTAHDPDLVLLDVMLPKIDGFTVCKLSLIHISGNRWDRHVAYLYQRPGSCRISLS